ncbi:MAG: hypothetical protein A3E78_02430 [Alphaproteobacteria bacterium RIFCSPHIGHO2_12_FULL_63_12]|nr:MAG: hypothetical protein A3E78_02430 [Alphaproteobacteria bacterium RIFCSPHIGHO2_12_FULL_63_12]
MDVNALAQAQAAPRPDRAGDQRNEALAQKRRELTQDHIARTEDNKARASDQLAELREAVARVTGANTRLSISKSENTHSFVYRAIDVDTGEVVNEWPQDIFVNLVRGVREDVKIDVDAGLMLDHVA